MSLLTDPNQGQPQGGAPTPGNQPTADWRSGLPEDLRSEKVFESIKGKDWSEAGPLLAKNYVHAQRLVGADKLVLPTDKSTPEEIAEFRTKLGVPAKPEDYNFTLPEGLKEEQLDSARIAEWRKELHEAGVPAKAADRIVGRYLKEEMGGRAAAEKARADQATAWETSIKTTWGDKFDENMNYARLALKDFGTKELVSALEDSGFGSHPEVVKAFAQIGRRLADDRAAGGAGGAGGSLNSPEMAQQALAAFNADKGKQEALFNTRHPNHEAVVKERREIFAAAFPAEKE